nr:MAG TPA: hypothetical protein [Caudoviricetes sp.]
MITIIKIKLNLMLSNIIIIIKQLTLNCIIKHLNIKLILLYY